MMEHRIEDIVRVVEVCLPTSADDKREQTDARWRAGALGNEKDLKFKFYKSPL